MNRSCLKGFRYLLSVSPRPLMDSLIPPTSAQIHRSLHKHVSLTSRQELKLTPRLIVLDTQRNFFSSKNEEAEKKDSEETRTEMSEAERALHDKIAELEEGNAELLDKYRRSLADFENLRARMNKQVGDAKLFGIQAFCKDLLEVADVLNKAISSVPSEALRDSQYLKD